MRHEFVHLHVHSEYSLLDAMNRFEDLAKAVKARGMRAIALTDHGNLFGAVAFYRKCFGQGVKPIIGCEVYVAPSSRHEKERRPDGRERGNHLTLLATSADGYRNLVRLSSLAFTEGFYYHPRVDYELLESHSDGLVALSGCLSSESSRLFLAGDEVASSAALRRLRDVFGPGNFFLELQDHGLDAQKNLVSFLLERSKKDGIPTVATNDVHYLDEADAPFHDALLCIGTRALLKDEKRKRYGANQFFLKTPEEMARRFSFDLGALSRTVEIAERVELDIAFGKHHLPAFPLPIGEGSEADYLRKLAREGLASAGRAEAGEYRARLERELDVIIEKGVAGYFLVVADFISEAKRREIPVGPGRGSAAGSLVAFALGITAVDPIKYGLLFERFLNPERTALPDIDVDICQLRRDEVIAYVKERYGHDRVAQIITFGTFGAKAVLRDSARVHGLAVAEIEELARLVPDQLKLTLAEAVAKTEDLKKAAEERKELFATALRLEGLVRHASRHAAGLVIANVPINEVAPLYKDSEGHIITQYDMKSVEMLGLLKMDLLGLKTLSVIDRAEKIAVAFDPSLSSRIEEIHRAEFDDPAVYELLSSGRTLGVFQLDSSGIRDLIMKIKPSRFEDLAAILALYRPGPMSLAEEFVNRKHGRQKATYPDPRLEEMLSETYGIILYQEQAMAIAHKLAGFTLAEADHLRKAMGKKDPELMASFREKFISGAVAAKTKEDVAEEVFSQIERFAGYGFNKSHAVAYAAVAYRTAWLKAHAPAAFMAASLSFEMGDYDKIAIYLEDCRRLGLVLLPPDIMESGVYFEPRRTAKGREALRFGLAAVKNVGISACEAVVEARSERSFESFWDFLVRVDRKRMNRRAVEALIFSGALDRLGPTRRSVVEALPRFWDAVAANARDAESEQMSLFGEAPMKPVMKEFPEFEDLSAWEIEYLGYYLTGHPLLKRFPAARLLAEPKPIAGAETWGVGLLEGVEVFLDKRGNEMARAKLESLTARRQLLLFSAVFRKMRKHLENGRVVLVKGKSEGADRIMVNEILPVEAVSWILRVRVEESAGEEMMRNLDAVLRSTAPGKTPVEIELVKKGTILRAKTSHCVEAAAVEESLNSMEGVEARLLPGKG